jgi:hypothetical protein
VKHCYAVRIILIAAYAISGATLFATMKAGPTLDYTPADPRNTLVNWPEELNTVKIPIDANCTEESKETVTKLLAKLQSNEDHSREKLMDTCGAYNLATIRAIFAINKAAPNMGADVHKGGFNVDLPTDDKGGNDRPDVAINKPSHCSAAQMTAESWAAEYYADNAEFLPKPKFTGQLTDSTLSSPLTNSDVDTIFTKGGLFYNVSSNDGSGIGDLNKVVPIGLSANSPQIFNGIMKLKDANGVEQTEVPAYCPGDAHKYDRNIGGHSTIFLAVSNEDPAAPNRQAISWSANKGTNGFGVTCQKISEIHEEGFALVRVTAPENLRKIPENRTALCTYADDKSRCGGAEPNKAAKGGSTNLNHTAAPKAPDLTI